MNNVNKLFVVMLSIFSIGVMVTGCSTTGGYIGHSIQTEVQLNFRNFKSQGVIPYLSDPISVDEKIIYEFPPEYSDTNIYQQWDGYIPPCTLDNSDACKYFPVQTANIKVNNIYNGIERCSDDWMKMAGDAALESVKDEGGPFGALILQIDKETNQIIRYWKNYNQVTLTNDPTAHAEVMTIRSACKSLGVFNLGEIKKEDSLLDQPGESSYCIIYSSAEPCPMCYSAICWANLKTLLFAATRFDAAVQGVNFSDEEIYNELATPYPDRNLKVFQCTTENSLDAFNLWKRSKKINY
jgi:guanine deaminase